MMVAENSCGFTWTIRWFIDKVSREAGSAHLNHLAASHHVQGWKANGKAIRFLALCWLTLVCDANTGLSLYMAKERLASGGKVRRKGPDFSLIREELHDGILSSISTNMYPGLTKKTWRTRCVYKWELELQLFRKETQTCAHMTRQSANPPPLLLLTHNITLTKTHAHAHNLTRKHSAQTEMFTNTMEYMIK